MFAIKPQNLAFTFLLYVVITLALVSFSEAKADPLVQRRDHLALNRLVKKRAPATATGPVIGAGAAPPLIDPTVTPTQPTKPQDGNNPTDTPTKGDPHGSPKASL